MAAHCPFCEFLGHRLCASCGSIAFVGQEYRGRPECAYCQEDRLALAPAR